MDEGKARLLFGVFNEIGIIEQLSRNLFEPKLPEGMMMSHFSVLNHLIRVRDGQTPLVLARAFQVPKTTMTHTLSGLEKSGRIEMRPNPDDGRSKCVWLTDKGRATREAAIMAMVPEMAKLSGQIDFDRLGAIFPVLSDLRAVLDKARDTP